MNIMSFWWEKIPQRVARTDATPFLSDVYNKGTRASKRLVDGELSGKSMVEMLGVLAIIGVLSLGAIAGYQKAMLKYKLNKQAAQISSILDFSIIHAEEFNRDIANFSDTPFAILLKKLNIIPQEMISSNGNIYDVFNNHIKPYQNSESNGSTYFGLSVALDKSNQLDICRNLYQLAQKRSAFLWHTVSLHVPSEQTLTNRVYGDNYCKTNCLRTLSQSQIVDLCKSGCPDSAETCSFIFLWNHTNLKSN